MSERKINLEEILKEHSNICFDDYEDVISAMKDACRQALELAAENIEILGEYEMELQQSILNTINQIE